MGQELKLYWTQDVATLKTASLHTVKIELYRYRSLTLFKNWYFKHDLKVLGTHVLFHAKYY